MSKYRKKPVVIEAVLWDGLDLSVEQAPQWLLDAVMMNGVVKDGDFLRIKTLDGTMTANIGDFIIRGVQKEIYPCKPDIFEATYEKVEDDK